MLPIPSPGDLPDPGIEPESPALQADSLPAKPQEKLKNTGVQEYWSGLPCPPPGALPHPGAEPCPGIEPRSPALKVDSLPSKTPGKPQ